MRGFHLLIVLTASLLVGACSDFAREYREANEERKAQPHVNDVRELQKVDLIAAIDPLGLGLERIVKRQAKLELDSASIVKQDLELLTTRSRAMRVFSQDLPEPRGLSAFAKKEEDAPSEFTGYDVVENAILGFYDPRYPDLLCGQPDEADSSQQSDANLKAQCLGRLPPPPTSKKEKRIPFANVTETRSKVYLETRVVNDQPARIERTLLNETTSLKRDLIPRKTPEPCLEEFQRRRRDRIQDRLFHASEINCDRFLKDLFLIRADSEFFGSALSIGLGAAGGIFSGASTILSTIQAAVTGTQEAFGREFFFGQTAAVVTRAIRARREELRLEILKARTGRIGDYTLLAAVFDAQRYHGACTVSEGFKELEKTLSQKVKALEDELNTFREAEEAKNADGS
ncbi:MAG: hypothetical protein AAF416_12750 [Pseudomonadota bacterium]